MGAKAKAISDLVKALEIAPDTISANRRLLLWASGAPKMQAASALIRQERNFDTLRKAIEVLQENGQQHFANVKVFEETIEERRCAARDFDFGWNLQYKHHSSV
jgi:hypothetical protein